MLSLNQQKQLSQILSRVGDMGFRRRVIEVINSLNIKDDDKILDCGCGEGFYTLAISELFPKVKIVAYDHDSQILKSAKKWLDKRKNVKFVLGKAETLPFKKDSFNKAILSEVIEHVKDDVFVLSEVRRVLKKGGLLAITVPSANYPFLWDPLNFVRQSLKLGHFSGSNQFLGGVWSWNHLRLYTPKLLSEAVLKSKMKIRHTKPIMRFVLPFNYWLLFLGKRFYNYLPVPKALTRSLEKFEYKDTSSSSIITLFLKAPLVIVDYFNDFFPGSTKNRHLNLFLLAQK